ncbi:phage tail length tape measure family protein [Pseudomonas aeruginosa]|nr:phage tail length tape measure family protein [Pseudomonas aeruginosa]
MNAYHNAERARQQQIATEQRAAEAAAKASAEFDKQQSELAKLLGAIDPVTRELEKLDNLEKRLGQARNSQLIDPEGFATYSARLQEQRERLLGTSDAMKVAGLSAGQYKQAMRQLPAQITDVVTSLASGMPVWMVAIQQAARSPIVSVASETFRALGEKIKSFFGLTSSRKCWRHSCRGRRPCGRCKGAIGGCRWGRQCQRRLHRHGRYGKHHG